MEPIEWIIIVSLIFGGHEMLEKHEREKDGVVVVENPAFERGKFYRTEDGYFISNLAPAPLIETTSVGDCEYQGIDDSSSVTQDSTSVKTPLLNVGCSEK